MKTITTEKANEIILAHARAFLSERYSYCKNESSGSFEIEAYTDYRDCLSDDTIKKAFEETETVEQTKEWLQDYMCDIFMDYVSDYESDIVKEITQYIEEVETAETLEALQETMYYGEMFNTLVESGLFYVYVDHEAVLSRSNIDLVISLENETSQDHEFSINAFHGNVLEWIENVEESIEYGEIEEEDISLITLLKTQGYTFEQFKAYAVDEEALDNKFLNSLINECENATTSLNCLVFTIQLNLSEYLNGTRTIEYLPKATVCGYVDFIHGGGSIVGIELEKDVDLTNVYTESFVDGAKYRYGVKEIYGQFI